MKNPTPLICLCFLLNINLFGQQNNELRGKVLYMNSDKQPAVGVKIAGSIAEEEQANIVYSNPSGSFALVFQEARDGHKVSLSIGEDDADGNALELVNAMEVEQCRIPAHVTDIFEIIVCQKGARDLVAQRYYKILRTSADREMKKLQRQVEQMILGKEKDYQLISALTQKIGKLEEQTDSISLYREAFRIASINKDNANSRIIEYLELLDEGKSIQEARGVLSKEKAAEELNNSMGQFMASIVELETNAKASFTLADYPEALSCYDTLIHYQEKMGIDSLYIAPYYQEAARVLLYQGEPRKALSYQEEVIRRLSSGLGKEDPMYARALTSMAHYLNDAGKYVEALEYNEIALKIKEEALDSLDSDLAYSYLQFAKTYHGQGHYQMALNNIERAIHIGENNKGFNSTHLANFFSLEGAIYRALGQFEEASASHHKALKREKALWGTEHPEWASGLNNLSLVYLDLGLYDTARVTLQQVVSILEDYLGPSHLDLASPLTNLGVAYTGLGNYDTAAIYHLKALAILEEKLDSNHQEIATSYNNIGECYYKSGEYRKAKPYMEKAIAILEETFNGDHPSLAITYNNLSTVYENLGEYNKALEIQLKSIKLFEKLLGEKHPNLAAAYANIGTVYVRVGQFEQALVFVQKAIAIDKAVFGESHINLAFDYNTIALVYRALEQNELALSYDQKALVLFQQNLGDTHPMVIQQNAGLGKSYAKVGQLAIAKTAFDIYHAKFPSTHKNYENWALYYALAGDEAQAILNLQEALKLGFKGLVWLKTDSSFRKLRHNKDFKLIVKELEVQLQAESQDVSLLHP